MGDAKQFRLALYNLLQRDLVTIIIISEEVLNALNQPETNTAETHYVNMLTSVFDLRRQYYIECDDGKSFKG